MVAGRPLPAGWPDIIRMNTEITEITDKDRKLALKCIRCPVCKRARTKQRGFCYWLVKKLEAGICPACRAYEKVYGRKAYDPPKPRPDA